MTPQELAAAVADVVQDHVRLALAPVQERLAVAESRLAALAVAEKSLGELRERVVTVETKAAQPSQPDPAFYELRDRVHAVETKAAPAFEVPADVLVRIAALEARPIAPVPPAQPDLTPVVDRLSKLEIKSAETAPVLAVVADLTKDIGTLRERVAVVEVRSPVPGPPGKDGADGVGWDDLSVKHDGERTFTIQMIRGERVKDAGTFTIPVQIYRGAYAEGRTYEPGDTVTYAGSSWHCIKTTVLRPDEVKVDSATGKAAGAQGKDFWTLVVKAGREGRPGRDGRDMLPAPVVSVGSRS